ncbi:glycosyltransferase family 2 protein [Erwinia persicina]|uniref:glycosyltransferase family 2 protein n=1 Tax=Erwinia persicina TaxID=55211 RepID=UPI001784DD86|nr:glycosyltransferase family 2 protein [Erwinia persicina]MBD8167376.1 glycosyltransferase family 2 protein [Erwinia persicina]QZQ51619.1 glycosyltransferase family 2 protein [Erwinia persicina]
MKLDFSDGNESNVVVPRPLKVSICCITYNQEKYLEAAIESFLSQKANFDIEIIIGNDASTDNTADIIRTYQEKYPNTIKSIIHKENVGANSNILSVLSVASGEWIAFCEGDDFWIDDYKLQKQVDAIRIYNDVDFCVHKSYIEINGNRTEHFDYGSESKLIFLDDVLSITGQFAPTSSYFFRSTLKDKFPSWFNEAPVGDLFMEIYGMQHCGLYMPDIMSVYRADSSGSWSETIKNDLNKFTDRHLKIAELLIKTKAEIRGYDSYFDKKITAVYLNMATRYIFEGDNIMFRWALKKAQDSNSAPSLKQKFYNAFRFFPRVIFYVHYIKSIISR